MSNKLLNNLVKYFKYVEKTFFILCSVKIVETKG